MKTMKNIEFHLRIIKQIENLLISNENYENHENHIILYENHENHEKP